LKLFNIAVVTIGVLTTQVAAETVKHTIKKGETLYTIAHKNHTTIEAVRKANGMKKGEILKIGRVLTVPTNTYFSEESVVTHRIKSGDSLTAIARKYHTDIETLKRVNGLKSSAIRAGKTLKVPTGTKVTRVASKTIKSDTHQNKKLAASIAKLPKSKLTKVSTQKEDISPNFFAKLFSKNDKKPEKIVEVAKEKLGHKYVWGASGTKGTYDCSSFTKFCYKKNGVDIPRTSIMQSKYGKFVKRAELQKGDLIFFDTSKRRKGYVNHVGIYLGDNKFIHASSARKKVIITSLGKAFYSQRYMGARRPL
jgi:cell wall-associated NlpC family hydrolase